MPKPMRTLDLKLPPLGLGAAFALLIAALSWLAAGLNVPFPGHRACAIAALALGPLLALMGVFEFRRTRTTVNPLSPERASLLVRSGVYRFTRNPMYLGMALCLVGVALWRGTLLGLPLVAAFCVYLNRFQIGPEERALRAKFGQQFDDYAARVRRWL